MRIVTWIAATILFADIGLGCKCPPLTEGRGDDTWYCGRELIYMGARGCLVNNFYKCPWGVMQEAERHLSCAELQALPEDPQSDAHFFKFCSLGNRVAQSPLESTPSCVIDPGFADTMIHRIYSRWGYPGPHAPVDERRRGGLNLTSTSKSKSKSNKRKG